MIKHMKGSIRLAAVTFGMMMIICTTVWAQNIEYDNLRELLIAGNTTLKTSALTDTIKELQEEITALESEHASMRLEYEIYKDEDEGIAEQYRQNASSLNATVKNLKKTLNRLTKATGANETMINTLTQTAQTLMCSYKQMEMNVTAAQKSYDAAVSAYSSTSARYAVGMASETDVTDALNTMLTKQNVLSDYTIRRDSVRFSLLSLLGITDGGDVVIGDVPAPDVAAIAAVDYASDEALLLSYDTKLQNANHQNGANVLKEAEYTEALGEAYTSAAVSGGAGSLSGGAGGIRDGAEEEVRRHDDRGGISVAGGGISLLIYRIQDAGDEPDTGICELQLGAEGGIRRKTNPS